MLNGPAGDTFAVPLSWTDRAAPSPWDGAEKNPPIFTAQALWTLVELLDSLRPQDDQEGES